MPTRLAKDFIIANTVPLSDRGMTTKGIHGIDRVKLATAANKYGLNGEGKFITKTQAKSIHTLLKKSGHTVSATFAAEFAKVSRFIYK